jgi:hypothetical protein
MPEMALGIVLSSLLPHASLAERAEREGRFRASGTDSRCHAETVILLGAGQHECPVLVFGLFS